MLQSSDIAPLATPGNEPHEVSARRSRRRREAVRHRIVIIVAQVLVFAVAMVAWELVGRLEIVRPQFIGSPGGTWDFLVEAFQEGLLWEDLRATVVATLLAFGLGSLVGVLIGISLGMLPRVDEVLDPFVTAINSTPRIALAPLFILIFGITLQAKVMLAFSIVVFIVIVASRSGVRAVDDELVRVVRVYGGSKLEMFVKVMLPVAIPSIFAGLRLGIVYSLLGVITSEFIAATSGMGQRIVTYSGTFQVDAVYGCIFVLVILASALNGGMSLVERRLLKWRPTQEEVA